jgi:hypothetical protein
MTGVNEAQHSSESDLAILLDATAAVVGDVSKVFQAVKRAIDSGDASDYRRARGAFDGLPRWQKARILLVATARAEEVAGFDDAAAPSN